MLAHVVDFDDDAGGAGRSGRTVCGAWHFMNPVPVMALGGGEK